jgi:hypothetical protein
MRAVQAARRERRRRRNERSQSQALAKRLTGYSLAAGAALATSSAAHAGIVYSGALSQNFGQAYGNYDLTMEGSNPEVRFRGNTMGSPFTAARLNDNFLLNGRVSGGWGFVNALPSGQKVGPATNTPNRNVGFFSESWDRGDWRTDGVAKFFGFSFQLETPGNPTVYGWAEVKRIDVNDGTLLGWAYEDSGAPIQVSDTGTPIPEASTLALFALGAAGVLAYRWRRKKKEA